MTSSTDKQEKYGVISLLDTLGTKGIWLRNNPSHVLENWNKLTTIFEDVIKDTDIAIEYTFSVFSDTIIIAASGAKTEEIILDLSSNLIPAISAGMIAGFYFRGCISVGKFYSNEKMIIGPAIDEAAQYYKLPEWIGVSASPTAHNVLENLKGNQHYKKDFENNFYKYDIPLKSAIEKNGWAINWTVLKDQFVKDMVKAFQVKNQYETIKDIIDEQLLLNHDMDIVLKWRNTLEFFNTIKR
jgi:hypothetical protein